MAFVEFVENEGRNASQSGVLDDLAQEHAFGNEAEAGLRAADIFEPDLITHFATQFDVALPSDPGRQETSSQSPRLQDDDLSRAKQPMVKQHLGHLGGLARTGG